MPSTADKYEWHESDDVTMPSVAVDNASDDAASSRHSQTKTSRREPGDTGLGPLSTGPGGRHAAKILTTSRHVPIPQTPANFDTITNLALTHVLPLMMFDDVKAQIAARLASRAQTTSRPATTRHLLYKEAATQKVTRQHTAKVLDTKLRLTSRRVLTRPLPVC